MPLFIQGFVIVDLALPILLGGNAGHNSLFPQTISEPISIITTVRQKMFGGGESTQQFSSPLVI